MNEAIEFYDGSKRLASVMSAMVPHIGSFISIRGVAWKVDKVTFALDYADQPTSSRVIRANVDLVRVPPC